MKKLSLFLVLCMLIVTACGCEDKDTNKQKYADNKSTVTSKGDVTSEPQKDKESEPTSDPTTDGTESGSDTTPDEGSGDAADPKPSTPTTPPPSSSGGDKIGTVYTRAQLEALSNTSIGYGSGTQVDAKNRPTNAVNMQNKYGKYDAYFIAPETNDVYLTFDLGYEYNNLTAKILDVLKEKKVKAIFFVTRSYCSNKWHDNTALVRRIIDEGHVLANHSVNHPVMPTLTIDKMKSEIMDLHNYIKEKFGYEMTLFRPPTGAFSERSLAVAQSLGYKTVNWSFAYYDYDTAKQPDKTYAYNLIVNSAHKGAIYLLHGVSETNAAVLGDVIDTLKKNYKISVLS